MTFGVGCSTVAPAIVPPVTVRPIGIAIPIASSAIIDAYGRCRWHHNTGLAQGWAATAIGSTVVSNGAASTCVCRWDGSYGDRSAERKNQKSFHQIFSIVLGGKGNRARQILGVTPAMYGDLRSSHPLLGFGVYASTAFYQPEAEPKWNIQFIGDKPDIGKPLL
jgi:hypothetical protein